MKREWASSPSPLASPVVAIGLFVVVFVGYVGGALVAFRLLRLAGIGATLFPPAGLLVASLVLSRRRHWPVIVAAGALAELVVDIWQGDYRWWELAGFMAANCVGALTGTVAILALSQGRAPDLARRRGVVGFLAGAAVGTVTSSIIGSVTVSVEGTSSLVRTMFEWWLGDSLGVVIVGSVLLAWGAASPDRRSLRTIEGTAMLVGVPVAVAVLYYLTDLPVSFVVLIAAVPVAARYGTRAESLLMAILAAVVIVSATAGDVKIGGIDDATVLVLFKLQFGAFALAGLWVAAESFDRERAVVAAADEHEIVRQLQTALLPPRRISGAAFVAEGTYDAASDRAGVGGDWYDVVELPGGEVFICVGDVVGHGAEAVVAMGRLRFALGAIAGLGIDPGRILERMDQVVRSIDGARFCTVWAGLYQPEPSALHYASAGHPPGLLLAHDGAAHWLEAGRSAPLGMPGIKTRPTATVTLDGPGTLLVFTDGTVERRGESLDVGLRRLELAAATLTAGPGGVGGDGRLDVEQLLASVKDPSGRDDAVLVRVDLGVAPARRPPRAVGPGSGLRA